jgi:hypothetical protein
VSTPQEDKTGVADGNSSRFGRRLFLAAALVVAAAATGRTLLGESGHFDRCCQSIVPELTKSLCDSAYPEFTTVIEAPGALIGGILGSMVGVGANATYRRKSKCHPR